MRCRRFACAHGADESGQASLEFAVIVTVLLVIALGLAALANALTSGALVDAASQHAPYALDNPGEAARYALLF